MGNYDIVDDEVYIAVVDASQVLSCDVTLAEPHISAAHERI